MIWLQHYEKYLPIIKDYANSCSVEDTKNVTHDVISIKAGAVWNDVIEAIKGDNHIVVGGERTVSPSGGWLQGGAYHSLLDCMVLALLKWSILLSY